MCPYFILLPTSLPPPLKIFWWTIVVDPMQNHPNNHHVYDKEFPTMPQMVVYDRLSGLWHCYGSRFCLSQNSWVLYKHVEASMSQATSFWHIRLFLCEYRFYSRWVGLLELWVLWISWLILIFQLKKEMLNLLGNLHFERFWVAPKQWWKPNGYIYIYMYDCICRYIDIMIFMCVYIYIDGMQFTNPVYCLFSHSSDSDHQLKRLYTSVNNCFFLIGK